ncbi:trypsin-like serine peptidase [Stenotrophomonas maltophilia]|uniref:trypsin-like serine peptidase n=1 Tax=Stenotrophomonas maltophilia TaxID=40324 RepID=UPI0015DE7A7B|nr:hypothetical protein [Stenotrophomonas maltophilia]MBA0449569.1 hypothetical protein [Stenotrophomonas maltophilia]
MYNQPYAFRAAICMAIAACIATSARAQSGDLVERWMDTSQEEVLTYWTNEKLAAVPDKGDVPTKPPGQDPLQTDGDPWWGTGPHPAGVGRLFLVRPDGKDASCTATVVDSPGGDVLLTALHCLALLDELGAVHWSSHLLYVPLFQNGTAPLGKYPIRRIVTPQASISGVLDTGFLQTHADASGQGPAHRTGSQAIRFDQRPAVGPRVSFGYPVSANGIGLIPPTPWYEFGNPEYTGQQLAYCATARVELSGCRPFGSDRILQWGLACVQGPGSSGGPVLEDFDFDSGRGIVVGVNSMGVVNDGRAHLCSAETESLAERAYRYIQQQTP